jgi:hypothetical protein
MLTVFYGEQVWGTYVNWSYIRKELTLPEEVYNGAYVYNSSPNQWQVPWSLADGTPCLIEDVPPILRTMILLLE